MLLYSVFFYLCCCDHRDLHSFPTRRSSDLGSLPGAPSGTSPGLRRMTVAASAEAHQPGESHIGSFASHLLRDGWVNRSTPSPPAAGKYVSPPGRRVKSSFPGRRAQGSSPGGCLVSASSETLVMQVNKNGRCHERRLSDGMPRNGRGHG